MKKYAALALLLATTQWNAFAQTPIVIVDTKFGVDPGDAIRVEKDPALPAGAPSVVTIAPPSTIALGRQPLGDLPTPYALITVAPREKDPETAANATLTWDLKKTADFPSGKFVVSYKVVPVTEAGQGGAFIVILGDENGQRIQQHWVSAPLTVYFKKSTLQATGKNATPLSVGLGDVYTVVISFDLEARTWSATANGTPLVDGAPFPEQLQSHASLRVIGLEFGSLGGRSDKSGGAYALQDVKMTRAD